MKMSKIILRATMIASVLTAVLLINACKKSSSSNGGTPVDNNSAASLSANGASSDNAFDDVLNVTIQTNQDKSLNSIIAHQNGTITNGIGSQPLGSFYCATVTVTPADTSTYPKTVVVDFGAGCTSEDTITRSGSITYTLSEKFRNPGAVISATFNNYKVNGYQLGGTYALTNQTSLSGVAYTTSVTGGTIVFPNDSSYSFSGTKTVTQTAGIGSTNLATYVFSVTGNYTITNTATGEMLSAKVTTPLVKEEICPNIVSGIESFTYKKGSASASGTFDFGNGTCDNAAVVTIGSFTNTVTLH